MPSAISLYLPLSVHFNAIALARRLCDPGMSENERTVAIFCALSYDDGALGDGRLIY